MNGGSRSLQQDFEARLVIDRLPHSAASSIGSKAGTTNEPWDLPPPLREVDFRLTGMG